MGFYHKRKLGGFIKRLDKFGWKEHSPANAQGFKGIKESSKVGKSRNY